MGVAVDNSHSVIQSLNSAFCVGYCRVNQPDLIQLLHIISGRHLPPSSLTQRNGDRQKHVDRLNGDLPLGTQPATEVLSHCIPMIVGEIFHDIPLSAPRAPAHHRANGHSQPWLRSTRIGLCGEVARLAHACGATLQRCSKVRQKQKPTGKFW